MAFTAWPFDIEADGSTPQEVTEDQFRHTLALASSSGVVPNSGIGGGTALSVSALDDSSGVEITSGYGQVNGYTCYNDDDEFELDAPSNAASNPRLYWVVLRLDRTERTITPEVVEGSASSSPQLPSLTRTDTIWEVPLAQFRREGGGGSISQMVDRRIFILPDGTLNTRSDARLVDPLNGEQLFEADTSRVKIWTQSQWHTLFDPGYPTAWQPITLRSGYTTGPAGRTPAWRWLREGRVELRGTIARSNGAALPDADYYARLPVETRPNAFVRHVAASFANSSGESMRLEVRSTNVSNAGRIVGWHHYNPTWVALDGWEYDVS